MYDILDHGRMISDRSRTDAYVTAIRDTVKSGDVVLDLGAGTGLFAMIACQAGARRVFAVDTTAYIEVARELAEANGFGDRIECIRGDSTKLTLDERADVVIADVRGVLPLFGPSLRTLLDARTRHLRDRGTMLPRRDSLFVALVESAELYESHLEPWKSGAYGLDLTRAKSVALNDSRKVNLTPSDLLSSPVPWTDIDYATFTSADAGAKVTVPTLRGGTAHGIAMWFDCTLVEGVSFSNAPGERTIYGSVFYPLEEPVELTIGDALDLDLAARFTGSDYIWRWSTALRRDGARLPLYRQSNFFAYPHPAM